MLKSDLDVQQAGLVSKPPSVLTVPAAFGASAFEAVSAVVVKVAPDGTLVHRLGGRVVDAKLVPTSLNLSLFVTDTPDK